MVDRANLLDVQKSLPVSYAILPRHVRQTLRHVDISAAVDRHMGLFIDYIITVDI